MATVEVLDLTEVYEVLIVSENMYGAEGGMEVMPPGFQDMDDYEEFVIIDVIILFSGNK